MKNNKRKEHMSSKIKWWKLYNANFDYFTLEYGFVLELVRYCHFYNISDSTREKSPKDGTKTIPKCFQYTKGGSWHLNADSYARFWADKDLFMGKDKNEI